VLTEQPACCEGCPVTNQPDPCSKPSSAEDVLKSISDFVDSVNRGDEAGAVGHLTPDVAITEDLAPYHWQGPAAGSEWMLAMFQNAQRIGVSDIKMELGKPTRVEVEGPHAYAIVEGLLTYMRSEGALHAYGMLTFALVRTNDRWLIRAFAWSGPEATP